MCVIMKLKKNRAMRGLFLRTTVHLLQPFHMHHFISHPEFRIMSRRKRIQEGRFLSVGSLLQSRLGRDMKKYQTSDFLNQSDEPKDQEFLSSYFELLKFLFNGCGEEISQQFLEEKMLPRLVALKMIVRQFEGANPAMSKQLDHMVDDMRGFFADDPELNEFFELARTSEEEKDENRSRFS